MNLVAVVRDWPGRAVGTVSAGDDVGTFPNGRGDGSRDDRCRSSSAASAVVPALAGFTVGVTAARRAEELGTMLERRGAVVLHGPAIRIVPLADDADLLAATKALVAQPPDITVATTGIGFRGWVEAAEGWGLGERPARRPGLGQR